MVGRFNLSANASWLLNRAAISETIQEPLRKPTTPTRRRREQLAQRTQRNAAQAFGRVDLKEKDYVPPVSYNSGSRIRKADDRNACNWQLESKNRLNEGDDQDHEHCAVFGALEKEQSQSQDYMPHPGEDRPVGKDKQVIAASTDFAVIAACQSTSIERCGEDHHPLLPIQGCSPSSGGSESCLTLSR